MRRATVVIGANLGDEGKGLMVDYHCARLARLGKRPIVVRFNGGAQAGHTVCEPGKDGRRHVFHHFGAGTLAGADTFLSRFFIVNPLLWLQEVAQLETLGIVGSNLYVDLHAPVSTPFDMLINQEAERARGSDRHGSCGIGINETIVRMGTPFALQVGDLYDSARLRDKIEAIRCDYLPQRMADLGLTMSPISQYINTPIFSRHFLDVAGEFRGAIGSYSSAAFLQSHEHVVFEGAQGLLLDEESPFFPHVTRSKTGLPNVLALAKEDKIDELDVTYVTRAYMTRHGAGPFPTEDPDLHYFDNTNVAHDFQGTLRFGRLDIDQLARSINGDLQDARGVMPCSWGVAVTHLDQVDNGEAIVKAVVDALDPPRHYESRGPTRADVTVFE